MQSLLNNDLVVETSAVPEVPDGSIDHHITVTDALQPEDRTNGIPNAALKKFLDLQKRREEMSKLSEFKLAMLDNKKETKASKKKTSKSFPRKASVNNNEPKEKKWEEVLHYFDVNSHLTGPVGHGIREPKSGLEEKINAEVKDGNFEKAEELSDTLAERELAVRINDAFGAKRYAEAETIKNETMKRKRQKKIPWGFETKERWEMKGNM